MCQCARVPFICKFKPGIPGVVSVPHDYDHEDSDFEDDDYEVILDGGDEMYQLGVQLVVNSSSSTPLLMTREDSAPIALDDELFVTSNINAVKFLSLAMEQCWLSPTSRVTSHATPKDILLIKAGCPVKSYVKMREISGSANAAFSLQVSSTIAS